MDVDDSLIAGLDEVGKLGLDAFALRSSEGYVDAKAQRPLAGESWDDVVARCTTMLGEALPALFDEHFPSNEVVRKGL